MSRIDGQIETYRAMKLGSLPVVALTIRQMVPQVGDSCQSLAIELLRDGQSKTVVLAFSGLRQFRLADLQPGGLCCLQISSVAADQMEGIRYRVANGEQDLTLSFYCADFEVSHATYNPERN